MFPKKRILYIGNKLSDHGYTPTGIEFIGPKLEELGHRIIYKSTIRNKYLRFLDMCFSLIINKNRYELVLVDTYSTNAFFFAYWVGKISRWLSKPYLCIIHGGDIQARIINSKKMCTELFGNAKTNIVLSAYIGEIMVKKGFPIIVIPNFIEVEKYLLDQSIREPGRILWVRSFHKKYQPKMAVEILNELTKSDHKVKLTMVGPDKDGSLQDCINLVKQLNLDHLVTFTGYLSKNEWLKLGKNCQIFLNTTSVDNFPVSVLEAMALSLPIVSTNAGGIPWLVTDGVDGFLSNVGDKLGMVESIKRLISTPALLKRMSINARKTAEKYDWSNVSVKWESSLL